ncbi:MAG: 3'-5' exonuclease [Dongiaceae bacterium]
MISRLIDRLRFSGTSPDPSLETPIADVQFVALDCETTGLDTGRDRIVSIATVPVRAGRLDEAMGLDRLVNPGCPIPARSSGVHGILDAHVAAAPEFPAILPELAASLEGAAMIGHEIGFDAAMIRREAKLARIYWVAPPLLDTMLLGAAFIPHCSDLRLEAIAERLGVVVRDRHTALGDARAAAEIFVRLLPAFATKRVRHLGGLLAVCREQDRALRRRLGSGW